MENARVVEIHGALDQPLSEARHREIQILLGVVNGGGDVMKAKHRVGHDRLAYVVPAFPGSQRWLP